MKKVKKGDTVIVISGKDKGKTGTISAVIADKVLVDGLNMFKKHIKANPNKNEKGGIVSREMPLHISNVAIYNSSLEKADKVVIKTDEHGKKQRYFKLSNTLVNNK